MRKYPIFSGLLLSVFLQVCSVGEGSLAAQDTIVFCTTLGNAEIPQSNQIYLGESNPQASSCSAHIWMSQTIDNLCGGLWIQYSVRLYPFNSVDFVDILTGVDRPFPIADATMDIEFDTRDSDLDSLHPISLHGVPYTNRLCDKADSYHRLEWTVTYDCNMQRKYEYLIRVVDCSAPDPVCLTPVQVTFPITGSISLRAMDFNLESVDDCTDGDSLRFSFRQEFYEPTYRFDCDTTRCLGSVVPVKIWTADQGADLNCDGSIDWSERNKSSCDVQVLFDDGGNPCLIEPLTYSGTVKTPIGNPVSQVTVYLSAYGQVLDSVVTAGVFQFSEPCPVVPLSDLRLSCYKNDNHKDGVSTIDIVRIQKQLLGIELLGGPYKWLAADANNSASVTALDLVEIRKLILGIYTEFPKTTSWRFIRKGYNFLYPPVPWPFEDTLGIANHPDTIFHVNFFGNDFIGVKIGDVNDSFSPLAPRADVSTPVMFDVDDRLISLHESIDIPVYYHQNPALIGFQLTWDFDGLELLDVLPGTLVIREDNIARHAKALTMSWSHEIIADDSPVFTLRVRASRSGSLNSMLKLTSQITNAEAYSTEGVDYLTHHLGVKFSREASEAYTLSQNVPNPFSGSTTIYCHVPVTTDGYLQVFDVHGVQRSEMGVALSAGYNAIQLTLPGEQAGVYYYRLSVNGFSSTRKMVILD